MKGVKIEPFSIGGTAIATLMADIPTPPDLKSLRRIRHGAHVLEAIDRHLFVNSLRFGRVYGFAQEQDGSTIQNLFPIQSHETSQISSSSKATLEMHTETAFHPWRPEVIGLLCVREDENAGTVVAHLPDIVDELSDDALEILHRKMFETSIDESFKNSSQHDSKIRTAIMFDGATSMTYDRALMTGLNDEANEALQMLSDAIDKVKKTIVLETGQLLLINNKTVVHGRTPFAARYDGTDRWLKRVMISTRLPSSPELTVVGGRNLVVNTRF